jgi:hypothetical protein
VCAQRLSCEFIRLTAFCVQALMDAFHRKWSTAGRDFLTFFREKYVPIQRKWAMCFRRFFHALVETNMVTESWHSLLKVSALSRRAVRRVATQSYSLIAVV